MYSVPGYLIKYNAFFTYSHNILTELIKRAALPPMNLSLLLITASEFCLDWDHRLKTYSTLSPVAKKQHEFF